MRIIDDVKLNFHDVLIVPKRSEKNSRKEVELARHFTFKHSPQKWTGVPIIAANMDTVGTFEMWKSLYSQGMMTCIHKHYTVEQWEEQKRLHDQMPYAMYSLGTSMEDFDKLTKVYSLCDLKWICIDVANGYSQHFLAFIERVRKMFPDVILVAGNVVTPEMTEALILAGADVVKVGIGGGSACTTRIKTGVGYPQLSAVIECADAAHGIKGHIISDGGCTNPGDIAKAFGAGADFVMLGGMLAGHNEAGEENLVYELEVPKKVIGVRFYGMSSSTAMTKHYGGVAEYRASEGKEVVVPYRGSVSNTLQEILGGLRSACTYIGASSIKEVPKRTTFIKTYQQHNPVFDQLEV